LSIIKGYKGAIVKVIRLETVLATVLLICMPVAAQQGTTNTGGQSTTTGQRNAGGTQSGNSQQGQLPGQSGAGTQGDTSGGTTTGRTPGAAGQVGAPVQFNGSGVITRGQTISGAAVVTQGPSTLSLEEAIQLAIRNNLATLLARERRREAEGFKQEARSALLPNISGTAYQASVTQNLAALGFQPGTFPGITNTFIGPFNNFDARAHLVQTIFNLSAIKNYQAGRAGVRVAEYEEQLAREQVASGTALIYLECLRSARSVAAAEANVELARALVKLAEDQRNAGIATGVDVIRAQTRLAQEQVRLAQAQTASEQAIINLQRVVGLPLGAPLTLSDSLRFTDDPTPSSESLIEQAVQGRPELRIAEEQIKLNRLERDAVRAEYLPSLEFVGDYGVSGITPTNTALPTRRAAVQLNVPIFNGGLTRGREAVAASRQRQSELELGNVRGQVEQDVRLALITLRTAGAEVRAADESVNLAERELEMARDRFRAGVGDNLEVINAQTALAGARDSQVTALAQYNAARLNLAAATGRAEAFRW
jgi:outer membrane protein